MRYATRAGGRPRHLARVWLPTLLVLALLAAGVGAYRFEWGQRYLPGLAADPVTEPEQVLPPAGLDLPDWSPPADDSVAIDTSAEISTGGGRARRRARTWPTPTSAGTSSAPCPR